MAIPWFAVLRALPWATILANGPALARAAEGLRSRSRGAAAAGAATEMQALAVRLQALEANQAELSEVLRQMADQTQRLTTAVDLLAARVRWLTLAAVGAAVLAAAALVVAIVLR
jgi:t-SNARE complex subunit (syntaxin)